ncbi:MAG TPA: transposase [Candidatus Methanoperedens sp.]|nr:transposase [Candidatus Methanoperedens sp.]
MNQQKMERRHDRHTLSLLTDHMVITPKYRGKILKGEVAFFTEAIIRGTCAEMDIKIIVKGRSSRLYRKKPHINADLLKY